MKDEWGNEAHYDFKNIMFNIDETYSEWIEACAGEPMGINVYYYTFSVLMDDGLIHDYSIVGNDGTCVSDTASVIGCFSNKIGWKSLGYTEDNGASPMQFGLSTVVFLESYNHDGSLYYGCFGNTISDNCDNIYIGSSAKNINIGDDCDVVMIYNGCYEINITNSRTITVYDTCYNITVEGNCHDNVVHMSSANCVFQCGAYNNVIYDTASHINIGRYSRGISIGQNNTNITVGDTCDRVTCMKGMRYVKIGDGVVKFAFTGNGEEVSSTYLRNIEVESYVNGINPSSDIRYVMTVDRNTNGLLYIGKDSNGNVSAYNPNDVYPALISAVVLADEINGEEV